jgi:hypothetical protein
MFGSALSRYASILGIPMCVLARRVVDTFRQLALAGSIQSSHLHAAAEATPQYNGTGRRVSPDFAATAC